MREYRTIYLAVWGRDGGEHFRIDGVPANVVEALEYIADLFGYVEFHVTDEPMEGALLTERSYERRHWNDMTRPEVGDE